MNNPETQREAQERAKAVWGQMDGRYEKQVTVTGESGSAAIRMCLLLNGAGCIALLSFLGAAAGGENMTPTLEAFITRADENIGLFAWGAGAAVVAAFLLHLTMAAFSEALYAYDHVWEHPYLKGNRAQKVWNRVGIGFRLATMAAAGLSVGCFLFGVARMQGLWG